MKVTRRGARADNGPSDIEMNNLKFSLDPKGIVLRDHDVKDFVTKAHYNYHILLSFEEVAEIIGVLGSYTEAEKSNIGKGMEKKLKSLLRIVQACIDE